MNYSKEMETAIHEYSRREDDTDETTGVDLMLTEHIDWFIEHLWHDGNMPHDKDKATIIILQNDTVGIWRGLFDTDEMVKRFDFMMAQEVGKPAVSMVKKWCYLCDILK